MQNVLRKANSARKERQKAVTAAEKEVDKAKAYHAMAQQLAETSTEVHKTEGQGLRTRTCRRAEARKKQQGSRRW